MMLRIEIWQFQCTVASRLACLAEGVKAKDALACVAADVSRGSNAVQDCVQVLCDYGRTLEYKSQASIELMKDAAATQVRQLSRRLETAADACLLRVLPVFNRDDQTETARDLNLASVTYRKRSLTRLACGRRCTGMHRATRSNRAFPRSTAP